MNDYTNYADVIDMLIASDDDYEPYGLALHHYNANTRRGQSEPVQVPLYLEDHYGYREDWYKK